MSDGVVEIRVLAGRLGRFGVTPVAFGDDATEAAREHADLHHAVAHGLLRQVGARDDESRVPQQVGHGDGGVLQFGDEQALRRLRQADLLEECFDVVPERSEPGCVGQGQLEAVYVNLRP